MGGLGKTGETAQVERRALTRLISASRRSWRALSKPKAFPPAGETKRGPPKKRGISKGPQSATTTTTTPHPGVPDPARTDGGHGLPTLEPVAELHGHGEPRAPRGLELWVGTRRRRGHRLRAPGGVWRIPGTPRPRGGAGGPPAAARPPLRTRLPLLPAVLAAGIKAPIMRVPCPPLAPLLESAGNASPETQAGPPRPPPQAAAHTPALLSNSAQTAMEKGTRVPLFGLVWGSHPAMLRSNS